MDPNQDLGETMIDYLSSNSDKLYTITALYNEITSSNSLLQIKDTQKRNEFNEKFRIEFLTLENKYKGVYRFIINERQYIIWSLESYDKLYETHIKNTQEGIRQIFYLTERLAIRRKRNVYFHFLQD